MRLLVFALVALCYAATLVAAWSKEDHEIFRLRDQVEASEGQGVTFYDFLGIDVSAGQEDINKAYRKKSRLLHPDKVKQAFVASNTKPQAKSKSKKSGSRVAKGPSKSEVDKAVKEASDRFARLGLVTNILRGSGRERYDHFLNNGFPTWRGTGYYYARFRPGLGSVLLGLFVFCGGGFHYGALYLSWKRQREFVDRYIRHARRAAWGDELGIKGIPGLGAGTPAPAGADKSDMGMQTLNRRQRRMQEKENKRSKSAKDGTSTPVESAPSGPTGERKKVTAENGKILIVDSVGNVYMEQENDEGETEAYLLDVDEIPKPTIHQTVLYRLPIWLYHLSASKVKSLIYGKTEEDGAEIVEGSDTESDETVTKARGEVTANGAGKRRAKRNGRAR